MWLERRARAIVPLVARRKPDRTLLPGHRPSQAAEPGPQRRQSHPRRARRATTTTALVVGTVRLGEVLGGAGLLPFDPRRDARAVCRALLEHEDMTAMATVFSTTGLTAARFNFALDHLETRDLATLYRAPSIGCIPGGWIEPNARTRPFAHNGE